VGEVAKDLHGQPPWFLPRFELFFDDLIDLIPERFRHNRFAFDFAPFALRFGDLTPVAVLFAPIEEIYAFGAGVRQNAGDLHIAPHDTVTGAIASDVQELSDCALAAMLKE
jgi:hypothetical protein